MYQVNYFGGFREDPQNWIEYNIRLRSKAKLIKLQHYRVGRELKMYRQRLRESERESESLRLRESQGVTQDHTNPVNLIGCRMCFQSCILKVIP